MTIRQWVDDNGVRHWLDSNDREHVELDAENTLHLTVDFTEGN